MQQGEDFQQGRISHTIKNVLALAAGTDDTLDAQHAELLRQCRLADIKLLLQIADAHFPLRQLTQQQHAVFVGEQSQGRDSLVSAVTQRFYINGMLGECRGELVFNLITIYYDI